METVVRSTVVNSTLSFETKCKPGSQFPITKKKSLLFPHNIYDRDQSGSSTGYSLDVDQAEHLFVMRNLKQSIWKRWHFSRECLLLTRSFLSNFFCLQVSNQHLYADSELEKAGKTNNLRMTDLLSEFSQRIKTLKCWTVEPWTRGGNRKS